MNEQEAPVGIFDSGMGGLSVLNEAIRQLPNENYLFYGDNKNAPYGTKEPEEVLKLAENVVKNLLSNGCKAIVIACNTATGVAAETLRRKYALPIIGIEPALKPASLKRKDGRILVLATPVTLSQEKFHGLMSRYGQYAVPVPCPGLMDLVEQGCLEGKKVDDLLEKLIPADLRTGVDVCVLGCTHYSFLTNAIQRFFGPNTAVIDGNEGTVRQLCRRLEENNLLNKNESCGWVRLVTSSDDEAILRKMQALCVQNDKK